MRVAESLILADDGGWINKSNTYTYLHENVLCMCSAHQLACERVYHTYSVLEHDCPKALSRVV